MAVDASSDYVIAARTIQLSARSLNNRGAVVRGRTIQWQVSDPTRASIDDSGLLAGWPPVPLMSQQRIRTQASPASGLFISIQPAFLFPQIRPPCRRDLSEALRTGAERRRQEDS